MREWAFSGVFRVLLVAERKSEEKVTSRLFLGRLGRRDKPREVPRTSRGIDFRLVETLRRRIAYRLQEFQLGGLSAEDEAFLDDLADKDDLANLVNAPAAKPRRSAGTRYVREWHGKTYEVILREKGKYELDGVFYTSLSAAAFAITGTHWNGKLFFGVKKL